MLKHSCYSLLFARFQKKVFTALSTLFSYVEVSYFLWMCETLDSLATVGKQIEKLFEQQNSAFMIYHNKSK